jgi:hypothetical protein
MKFFSIFTALLLSFTSDQIVSAQDKTDTEKQAKDERLDRETPEGTVRIFAIGVALTNEKLIKSTALKISDEDLKYLLKKTQGLRSTPKEIKEVWANAKVSKLKPGDKFTLPGGKEITVGADEVSDDRLVVVLADSPIPTRLYKVKGYWWVDPAPVIAGRKAAEAAAQKRKEQETAQPKEDEEKNTAPTRE